MTYRISSSSLKNYAFPAASLAVFGASLWLFAQRWPGLAGVIWKRLTTVSTDAATLRSYGLTFALCLALEAAFAGYSRSTLGQARRFDRSFRIDVLTAACYDFGISAALGLVFGFGLHGWAIPVARLWNQSTLSQWIGGGPMAVVVLLVVFDFLSYWYHRLCHRVGFLWEAHAFHHAATDLNLFTGNRVHPIEDGAKHVFIALPMAMVGVPTAVLVEVFVLRRIIDILQHSALPWDYGWAGRWLFFSPLGHRVHHSTDPRHFNKNFGDILVIWDRLFGTYHPAVACERVGLDGYALNRNPLQDLGETSRRSVIELYRSTRALVDRVVPFRRPVTEGEAR
jgi:sterol desaturase/sphingolipid hydroxylase (fatty acid hydroxylase superfamily)